MSKRKPIGRLIGASPIVDGEVRSSGVISTGEASGSIGAFDINNTLRFDGSADYLLRTQETPTESKKWTWSGWVKLNTDSTDQQELLGAGPSNDQSHLQFISNRFGFRKYTTAEDISIYAQPTFTDTSVWNHFVIAYDTSTDPTTVSIWANGQPQSLTYYDGITAATYPDFNEVMSLNKAGESHYIGRRAHSALYWFDGQLAEVHFVDGQALDPTYFGEYNSDGVWVPKEVTGIDYGNNGFYLDFKGNDTGVTLLFDGSSATIDASGAGNNVTNNGATITSVTGPYNYTQEVISFDGTNDYLEDTIAALGTDDWTIETWVKFDNFNDTYNRVWEIGYYDASGGFRLNQDNATKKFYIQTVSGNSSTRTTVLSVDVWYHLAVTRSGDTFSFYINGSLEDSITSSNYNMTSTNFRIGCGYTSSGDNTPNNYTAGDYVDFRITRGYARYSDSFTPPTSALTNTPEYLGDFGVDRSTDGTGVTLLVRGNTLTDLSSNGHTLTANGNAAAGDTSQYKYSASGSMSFGGGSDYISIPDDASLELGSDDFTVECWAYYNGSMPNNNYVFLAGKTYEDTSSTRSPFLFGTNNTSGGTTAPMRFLVASGSSYVTAQDTANFPTSQWVHLAGTRSGDTITLWVNGVAKASATVSGELNDNSNPVLIGTYSQIMPANTAHWNGNVEDFRITRGYARYTDSFTPPTSALTNDDTWDKLKNDFSVEGNITPDDQLLDTPNLRFSALSYTNNTGVTLSNSNLTALSGTSTFRRAVADSGISSGAYYWEVLSQNQNAGLFVGIVNTDNPANGSDFIGNNNGSDRSHGWYSYLTTSDKYNEGTGTSFSLSAAVVGDIIRVRFDRGTNTLDVAKNNGSWTTISSSVASGTWYPVFGEGSSGNTSKVTFNFGQDHTFAGEKSALVTPYSDANGNGKFYYEPPEGFLALVDVEKTKVNTVQRWNGLIGNSVARRTTGDKVILNTGIITTSEHYQSKL